MTAANDEAVSGLEAEAERVADRIRARGGWASADLRIRPDEAAELLDVSPATLRNWRYLDTGPVAITVGAKVSYRIVDVLAVLKTRNAA